MKTLLFTLAVLASLAACAQSQEKLKVGEIRNNKLEITDPDALRGFFLSCLNKSGKLGNDIVLSYSPQKDRIFVSYPVSGNKDKVTSIGVMLVNDKDDAYIVPNPPGYSPGGPGGGGSATITCIGNPCSSCYPDVNWSSGNWFPTVSCACNVPDGICNMSVSFSININIGLY